MELIGKGQLYSNLYIYRYIIRMDKESMLNQSPRIWAQVKLSPGRGGGEDLA